MSVVVRVSKVEAEYANEKKRKLIKSAQNFIHMKNAIAILRFILSCMQSTF